MSKSNYLNQKIAIIGCGYWGSIIVNSLLNIGHKNIIIFDSKHKNSIILKKKFNVINISNNYSKLLNDESIKTFFFATPPSINFKIVKMAIIKKKNIFIEKPGFTKIKEFKDIIRLSKRYKSLIMFGYVYCFNSYIEFIKKIINNNKLGKIRYISFQRKNLGPIRADVNSSYDLSAHDLSIILYLFGKLPKIIKHIHYPILKKEISDISNLHMKLQNIFIDINTSWLNPNKERTITIIGQKKMLFYNEMDLINPLKIYNKFAEYPDLTKFNKKFINSKAKIYIGESKTYRLNQSQPLTNEIKYFLNCIKLKDKPKTNIEFAFKISKFLDAVN